MNSDPHPPIQPLDSAAQRVSQRYAFAQTAVLIAFAAVAFLTPKDYLFAPAALAGNLLCAAGIGIMLLAFLSLRDTIQIAPEPKAGKSLVETGVYKVLRHPIYTGILICAAGLFLKQPTIWMAAAGLLVTVFLAVKVRFEEKLLSASYPGYAAYRTRSWGLFPGIRR